MVAQNILSEQRLAGALLVLAFISFAAGAGLATSNPKGSFNIFTLPLREYLSVIARYAVVWRWANIVMGAAVVFLLAGLTVVSAILEAAGERVLSRLGLMGMLLAAALWLVFSAFRASVTIQAAQDMDAASAAGSIPPYYEPLAGWAGSLFFAYAALGFVALATYGLSLLQVALLPGWAGWASIVFSIAMLVVLVIRGDNLPIFHYLPPLLVGILLLLRG